MLYDFNFIRTDKLSHRQKGDFKSWREGEMEGELICGLRDFVGDDEKALEIDGGDDCSTL